MSKYMNNFDGLNVSELIRKLKDLKDINPATTEVCLGNSCCSSDYVPIESLEVRFVPDDKGNLVRKVMLFVKEEL